MATVRSGSQRKKAGAHPVLVHESGIAGSRDAYKSRVSLPAKSVGDNRDSTTALARAVYAMTHRTPEQIAAAQTRAMKTWLPLRAVPDGQTLADVVCGKWPGDETDEEIEAALRELS